MNAQNTDTPNAACPSRRLLSRPGIVLLAGLLLGASAVYKGDDGKVYVSGMNTRLMGTMFGGNVADVMGGQVARDEAKILSSVVKGS